ncbi:hypothetical protein KSS87_015762 [Heliosperma pusillum]|nr:hypothetical protein KSS87_015762 [Heliosperma pusillum]
MGEVGNLGWGRRRLDRGVGRWVGLGGFRRRVGLGGFGMRWSGGKGGAVVVTRWTRCGGWAMDQRWWSSGGSRRNVDFNLNFESEALHVIQDSAERAHAENTLRCFSMNTEYIPQCQYILDNALTPYALMLASSSLLKQVTEHSLPLQLRLDISNHLLFYLGVLFYA